MYLVLIRSLVCIGKILVAQILARLPVFGLMLEPPPINSVGAKRPKTRPKKYSFLNQKNDFFFKKQN
jgi:hypothetical protein